jgi:hypothetical protein
MKQAVTAAFLSVFIVLCSAAGAQAQGPKPWIFSWGYDHWNEINFEKPYMEPGKDPHNSQWDGINWAPADWVRQHESELELIEGFYHAGIIHDQYVKKAWFGFGHDIIPVVEVGPAFYRLGGWDKRRVAETLDSVYGITNSKTFGMFVLVDFKTGNQIGTYTQYGLTIQ